MKICSKCSQEKSLSEFHRDKTSKDGYRTICKECRRKKSVIQVPKSDSKNVELSKVKDCNTSVMADFFTSDDVPVLREMLDWFKQKKGSNTNVINVLQVDLPESECNVRSIRVNDKVWSEWQKFCKKYPQFKAQDLVSQAFLDFINSYNRESF